MILNIYISFRLFRKISGQKGAHPEILLKQSLKKMRKKFKFENSTKIYYIFFPCNNIVTTYIKALFLKRLPMNYQVRKSLPSCRLLLLLKHNNVQIVKFVILEFTSTKFTHIPAKYSFHDSD